MILSNSNFQQLVIRDWKCQFSSSALNFSLCVKKQETAGFRKVFTVITCTECFTSHEQFFFTPLTQKIIHYHVKIDADEENWPCQTQIKRSLKSNIDSFIEYTFDHVLLVYVRKNCCSINKEHVSNQTLKSKICPMKTVCLWLLFNFFSLLA